MLSNKQQVGNDNIVIIKKIIIKTMKNEFNGNFRKFKLYNDNNEKIDDNIDDEHDEKE